MGWIADSMVRLRAGQSFATNPKNDWLEPGPGKVMRLVTITCGRATEPLEAVWGQVVAPMAAAVS